jgi:hypothetical protein
MCCLLLRIYEMHPTLFLKSGCDTSCGTAAAFLKAGCTHAKTVNRPTFSLSPIDLIDIPSEARSIGNRFITQIWAKGG